MGAKGSGRRPRSLNPDGTQNCNKCGTAYPATEEYFYKNHNAGKSEISKIVATCKECNKESARENAHKNKLGSYRRWLLSEARKAGLEDSIIPCPKCNQKAPESSFVEWDTNVYYNGQVLIKGHKYICGVCKKDLNDRIFSQIAGSYELHKEKTGYVHKRKDRKNNKA